MRRSLRRPLAVVSSTVAVALLLTASAEAQRKKAAPPPAKKKPAATAPAKPKPDATKPAEEATTTEEKSPTEEGKARQEVRRRGHRVDLRLFFDRERLTVRRRQRQAGHARPRGGDTRLSATSWLYGRRVRHAPQLRFSAAPPRPTSRSESFRSRTLPAASPRASWEASDTRSPLGSTYKVPPAGSTTSTKLHHQGHAVFGRRPGQLHLRNQLGRCSCRVRDAELCGRIDLLRPPTTPMRACPMSLTSSSGRACRRASA